MQMSWQRSMDRPLVQPFNDLDVATGQGTIAMGDHQRASDR